MKDKIFGVLQRVGRSFMLPIVILPVAGLLLGIGSSFTNETTIATYGLQKILGSGTLLNSLLIIMNKVGSAVFDNLPLIFAVGVAIGMAKKEKEVAALSALIAYFVMNVAVSAMLLINNEITADGQIAADVLEGNVKPGKRVLVVGGGMVGCEVADFLGELGHQVSIVELRDELGADVIPEHRKFLMKELNEYQVQGITGAKVTEFHEDGVSYVLENGTEGRVEQVDTVVLAMGYRNYDPLSQEIKVFAKEVFVIGDSVRARRAMDATKEAFETAMMI